MFVGVRHSFVLQHIDMLPYDKLLFSLFDDYVRCIYRDVEV